MYHGLPDHRAELRKTVLRQPTVVGKSQPKPKGKGRKSAGGRKSVGGDGLPEQSTETFPIVVTTYDMVRPLLNFVFQGLTLFAGDQRPKALVEACVEIYCG